MNQPTDPRPAFAAATAWTAALMAGVDDEHLDSPTPCTEFDVRTLCAHLVGVARRAEGLAAGTDILTIAPIAEVFDAETFADTIARARDLWSDDTRLTTAVTVPWGTVPGAGALWGYVNEVLVHGWDLAVATGQDPEADPDVVAPVLVIAQQFIPAEIRADAEVPFGPVVEPRHDAGPTERLANWSGRESQRWARGRAHI